MHAHAEQPGQTPRVFYLWAFVSVIAAVIQDKFYFQKFPGSSLLPNMYIFLVGPSGVGKGTAINFATDYLRPHKDSVRMFVGRTTHSKWMEYITTPKGRDPSAPCENGHEPSTTGFLVTEELAWCISDGQRAQEFVRMMTAMYTQTGRDFEEMTQMFGHHVMTNPCINWLAGTTVPWLVDAIGIKNILSGFASRCVWLIEDYDLDKMCAWAVFPQDFEEMREYVKERLIWLALAPGGELMLTAGARFALDRWWAGWHQHALAANSGGEKELLPLYSRGHDLVLKIAIIIRASCFDPFDPARFYIDEKEILQSIAWVENLMLIYYPRLLALARKSEDKGVEQTDKIAELIKGFGVGECSRTELTKKAHNRGMNAKVVEAGIVALNAQVMIEHVPGPGGRGGYWRWTGKDEKRGRE